MVRGITGLTLEKAWPPFSLALAAALCAVAVGVSAAAFSPFLALFLFAGTVAVAFCAFYPGVAMGALLAVLWLLPFGTLPFRVVFQFTFLDLLTGGILLLAAWQIVLRRTRLPVTLAGILAVLYAAVLLLAGCNGLRFGVSDDAVIRAVKLATSVLLFLVVVSWLATRRAVSQARSWFIMLAALEAGVGITLFVLPPELTVRFLSTLGRFGYPVGPGVLRYLADTSLLRATGTSIDPNMLGGALVLAIALGVAWWASTPRRWWLLPVVGILLVCLLLTRSRAALLGTGAALSFLAVVRYRHLLVPLVIGAIGMVLLPSTRAMLAHLLAGLRAQDRAAAMRLDEYAMAWRLIQAHPWLGVGFGSPPTPDSFLGVSSIYLQTAEQSGVLSTLLFALAAFAAIWATRAAWWSQDRTLAAIAVGCAAGLVGALVTGLFDQHYVVYPHLSALFWFTAGLGVTTALISTRKYDSDREDVVTG